MLFSGSNQSQNVFVSFIELLKVKHTKWFANKLYGEHPYKYSLYGLSKMLSDYSIENVSVRVNDKENVLSEMEAPFIAHVGSDFVVVYNITPNKIDYLWDGTKISLPIEEFYEIWTGVALFAETNKTSCEPNYKENKRKELFYLARNFLFGFFICTVAGLFYAYNQLFDNIGLSISLLINLVGIYIGSLLVLKQTHIQSKYADKVCSLFKQQDCNDVLESKAAKILGTIGWSEIGLGYFISNALLILSLPHLMPFGAIINLFTLPYTFWSIWYQKFVAKQWCFLCLIVQAILWSVFIVNYSMGFISVPSLSMINILSVMSIYIIPFLGINILVAKFSDAEKIENITQEMNSIKATDEVFLVLLKKQLYYEVNKLSSSILFGNPNATTLITIFTNPHCEPCSKMHKRMEAFLEETENKFCIQYIFSSFNDELSESNKFMISAFLNNETDKMKTIYREWFEKGKYSREEFYNTYNYDFSNVETEFNLHQEWKSKTGLRATPIILVNGYKLPDNYKIEDLKYFYEIDVNVNN